MMGKQKPKKPMNRGSDSMLRLKAPIHRVVANSITKNTPVKKDLFKVPLPVTAVRLPPNLIGDFVKKYGSKDIWSLGRIKRIHDEGEKKLVVLDPKVKLENTDTLSDSARSYFQQHNLSIQPYTVDLDYNFWTVDEILTATLPPDLDDIPSGYAMVGHIAHMNLRDHYLPYKYHIGAVVLSKTANQGITTVVNKLDIIHSTYRNFEMEVIAGEEDFHVTQTHLECTFTFDFSKVYWNTRLETEHRRLVEGFREGEVVCDVFAGVGPFAVPAGKRKVFVLANDLNPYSYSSLLGNIKTNKVGKFVKPFCEDGRAFIRSSTKRMKEWHETEKEVEIPVKGWDAKKKGLPRSQVLSIPPVVNHFVMNLPATAIEFLDAFRGLYHGAEELFEPHTDTQLPKIHVYCFDNPELASKTLLQDVRKALGYEISEDELTIHDVRNVAPNKEMYCCTFMLPPEVAFASK